MTELPLIRAFGARLFVVLGIVAASCSTNASSETRSVDSGKQVASVVRGSLDVGLSLSGELDAKVAENMTVPATGTWQLTIEWVVDDGVLVKKGDRVVEFDSSAFSAEIEQKRMAVKQAQRAIDALLAQHRLTVADKQQIIDVAALDLEKAKVFAAVSKDLISERDWQERQLAMEAQSAAVTDAKADAASSKRAAELDLKVQQIAFNAAEKALVESDEKIAALTLTAPRDGLALLASHPWDPRKKLVAGESARVGWTVVRLPQLSEMLVRARLSDVDDGQVVPGLKATVVFDAFPQRPQKGIISAVSPVARSLQFGSERRSFDVDVALAEGTLDWMRPGMSARVDVSAAPREDLLLVPRAAITFAMVSPSAVDSTTRISASANPASASPASAEPASANPVSAERSTSELVNVKPAGANPSTAKLVNADLADTNPSSANLGTSNDGSAKSDVETASKPTSGQAKSDKRGSANANASTESNQALAPTANKTISKPVRTASRERATVERSSGELVEVNIGICDQFTCEVRTGLIEGDAVVVRGNN